jgi:hypothetical protein
MISSTTAHASTCRLNIRNLLIGLVLYFYISSLSLAAGWTTTGSLSIPRTDHTITLLQNGKILVTVITSKQELQSGRRCIREEALPEPKLARRFAVSEPTV